MTDDTTLRMPEHNVWWDRPDEKSNPCRGGRVPGYALVLDDGHLRCNRCGWVTPEKVVLTWDEKNDRHYLTWEEYVADAANGWLVIAVLADGKKTWPWALGPYGSREEANRRRVSSRNRLARQRRRGETKVTGTFFVRPAWKDA